MPLVLDGDGFQSHLLASNVSESSTRCVLELNGAGLDAERFEDHAGLTGAGKTVNFELAASGGNLIWSSEGEEPLTHGHATLNCAEPVAFQALITLTAAGRVAAMATIAGAHKAAEFQFAVMPRTGRLVLVFANIENTEASCEATLENSDGVNAGNGSFSVPENSTAILTLDEIVRIPASFTGGTTIISCDRQLASVGLPLSGTVFTSLPPAILSLTPETDSPSDTPSSDTVEDPFARWNELEPRSWWRESEPYSCMQTEKRTSPWLDAGLVDLGGSDPLSLIRYFGNSSYLRYGNMGFHGCTRLDKYPDAFHLDPPADPAYYSRGELEIRVDIARVPPDARGWHLDDGKRVSLGMAEAVGLLNTHVAAYFRRVSGQALQMIFHAGNEFEVGGDGSPDAAQERQFELAGVCLQENECENGAPGGLNRILLNDVATDTGGSAYNGWATFGLASFVNRNMELIVHEIGHGWMAWPHSYFEAPWQGAPGEDPGPPNPYSNLYDIMSSLALVPILGWSSQMPATLAINRYAAGWIRPENVALHTEDSGNYTLGEPLRGGDQFLVIHSGRSHAFTTLEVLEERPARFEVATPDVYDPDAPGQRRARRYDGVLVSRYDQSAGTGIQARFGPALYHRNNPDVLVDLGWGRDDYALISNGETREIGGGVTVGVSKNAGGGFNVSVSGGKMAEFDAWCAPIWFSGNEYDTGCLLDEAFRE